MEAIFAGSTATFKLTAVESYERVTPFPDVEMYSYARMSRSEHHCHVQERKDLKYLYDDPDTPIMIQAYDQLPIQSQSIANEKSISLGAWE